jgi:hypothetical protein
MWTREYAFLMLTDGDEVFDVLSAKNASVGAAEREAQRASKLRARADDAWRQRNFSIVVNSYSEIESEMQTVELRKSERGRLDYARRAIDQGGVS